MKTLLVVAATLVAIAAQAQAQAQTAAAPLAPTATPEGCIQVEARNVRPQKGQLMVAAYIDAESFGKKPVASLRVPAGDAVTSFQLCGLKGNSVALTMFQDIDSDGKMNKNLVGMPTEPWGSSGTPGTFGPSWETGRVAMDGKPVVVMLSN
jgi:uncharacterized protein (DUF2141 family)